MMVRIRRRPRRRSLTEGDWRDRRGYAAAFCWRARIQFQGRSSSIRLA
jgi:hypothetical protein